ncbi:hypothetical protein D9758_005818 [Tetrapyrgos nigripes]|uniref:Uncharacterized protein n=1 Tax=Tetrapyrgos nigripes TaxID=182062 RepID=A0A8H5GK17_9AGAR|nr:hypothetical protein D9758_005818 [Tetrapyrgos nigripes]
MASMECLDPYSSDARTAVKGCLSLLIGRMVGVCVQSAMLFNRHVLVLGLVRRSNTFGLFSTASSLEISAFERAPKLEVGAVEEELFSLLATPPRERLEETIAEIRGEGERERSGVYYVTRTCLVHMNENTDDALLCPNLLPKPPLHFSESSDSDTPSLQASPFTPAPDEILQPLPEPLNDADIDNILDNTPSIAHQSSGPPTENHGGLWDWLDSLPPAEIYDSECGEDPQSRMIRKEGGLGPVPNSDSESEYWDSDKSFLSEDSDVEEGPVGFDWDAFEWAAAGLSVFDKMGEDFEVHVANLANRLAELDLAICKAYSWKVQSHTPDEYYKTAPNAFGPRDGDPLSNLHAQRGRILFLSGFRPREYHCCINLCIHADKQQCPYCKEKRLNAAGQPRKIFTYIPLIPRLQALFGNRDLAKEMDDYRTQRNPREVALGLSTDGFAPFKKWSKTAWPIILINYNLPPDVRCHLEHILSLGVIPGPTKPHNWDSFLWPLMEELSQLASDRDVPTVDILESVLFPLQAHIITVFGDIPAMSMVMKMKGHNGKWPCCLCMIEGVPIPSGTTHYVPLDRSSHPDVKSDPSRTKRYDPLNLPLRHPSDFMSQAAEVDCQPTKAAADRFAKKYGIKGTPMLSFLGSLEFPMSIPYDFMHMVFENLLPNLVLHWTGDFKGMDEGDEEYRFAPTVWEAIGSDTAKAGDTIPSAFDHRYHLLPPKLDTVPENLIDYAIAPNFSTRFGSDIGDIRKALGAAVIEEYGAVKRIDSEGGDLMRCSTLYKPPQDSRDPTFVRYSMYVDIYERRKKMKPKFKLQTFYGQLEHLFVVKFDSPESEETRRLLGVGEDEVLQAVYILAACRRCLIHDTSTDNFHGLNMHLYSRMSALDVLDVETLECLVGRVPDVQEKWVIIDRNGALADTIGEEGSDAGDQ